jgi:uncharacterized protein YjbI with pentapeptide repeats
LRSGPRAWNAWRENNPSTVPDLTGIVLTLSERQMGPVNGGPINLKSARLQGAMLRFATLSAADLEAADMSDADFVHARLDRANLSAANLSNALLGHADFAGATLTKANFSGASLQHAILSAADLEAADMSDADLMHARFDQANLSAANLTDARLDHADFTGANLAKANLCGASLQHARNLTESQLKESTGSGSTILPPHLRGSVPWSVARSPTEIERHDLAPRARPAEVDVSPLGNRSTASIGRRSPPRTAFTPSGLGNQVASWGRFSLGIPASSGWWMRAMEGLLKREEGTRFIGTIERLAEGWRASFRLRVPSQVFTQRDTEVFDTELQATKWVHTQATARGFSSIELRTRINSSSIHGVSSYAAPALFIGVTLVISAFVWRHMNEAVPLDISGAQRWSESFLTQPKPSLDTGTQGLQSSAPETLIGEKAAAERQPLADAEIPRSAASTVEQTETTPEQRPVPETERATVPQATDAKADLQASYDAKPSAEVFGSREHAAGTPEQGDDSALVSAESPPAPSQHAIVPDLSAAAPIPDPQGPTAAEQPAEALAVNTPEPSAPVSKAPDLPAEAAATPELPDPQAAEQPAEALAVNTPEQHLDSSPPNYTALPSVTTAPPSVDVTALPDDVEIVPKPFRKPVIQKPVGEPVNVTALPNDAEIVPKPVSKPGIQNPAGKPVIQKPVAKPVIQKPVEKPVIKRADVDSKAAGSPRANGQNLGNKKAEPRPTGRSSTADLLAGGL